MSSADVPRDKNNPAVKQQVTHSTARMRPIDCPESEMWTEFNPGASLTEEGTGLLLVCRPLARNLIFHSRNTEIVEADRLHVYSVILAPSQPDIRTRPHLAGSEHKTITFYRTLTP